MCEHSHTASGSSRRSSGRHRPPAGRAALVVPAVRAHRDDHGRADGVPGSLEQGRSGTRPGRPPPPSRRSRPRGRCRPGPSASAARRPAGPGRGGGWRPAGTRRPRRAARCLTPSARSSTGESRNALGPHAPATSSSSQRRPKRRGRRQRFRRPACARVLQVRGPTVAGSAVRRPADRRLSVTGRRSPGSRTAAACGVTTRLSASSSPGSAPPSAVRRWPGPGSPSRTRPGSRRAWPSAPSGGRPSVSTVDLARPGRRRSRTHGLRPTARSPPPRWPAGRPVPAGIIRCSVTAATAIAVRAGPSAPAQGVNQAPGRRRAVTSLRPRRSRTPGARAADPMIGSGGPQCRTPRHLGRQLADHVGAGEGRHPDGQVDGRCRARATAECSQPRGRYSASPAASPRRSRVPRGRARSPRPGRRDHGSSARGCVAHRGVHRPVLLPAHLQDEHVVHVVVRVEAARGLRRDVRVDLGRVPELGHQLAGERPQRAARCGAAPAARSSRRPRTPAAPWPGRPGPRPARRTRPRR